MIGARFFALACHAYPVRIESGPLATESFPRMRFFLRTSYFYQLGRTTEVKDYSLLSIIIIVLLRIPASQTLLLYFMYLEYLLSLHGYYCIYTNTLLTSSSLNDDIYGFQRGCDGRPTVLLQLWSEPGRFRAATLSPIS